MFVPRIPIFVALALILAGCSHQEPIAVQPAPAPAIALAPPPPPPSSDRPSMGGSGRYVPGAFSRMRQGGGNAPPPSANAPPRDADGFTQVRPRSGNAYRPPSAR